MKIKLLAAAGLAAMIAPAANAAIVVNVSQVGSDVQIATTGSFNTKGLTTPAPYAYTLVAGVGASQGYFATGVVNSLLTGYAGISGPTSFGSGLIVNATSSSGMGVGLNSGALLYLPRTYVSGSALASQDIFAGTTISALGLVTGQYVYTAPNDTITVNVLAAAVPEAASWAMMVFGLGAVGSVLRRRKNSTVRVAFA